MFFRKNIFRSLKFLILFTAVANIVLPWIDITFKTSLMYTLFALSKEGVNNLFLWQPLSYIFVNSTHNYGVNFSMFFSVALKSLFLWSVGKKFLLKKGIKHFFIFYFASSLFIGLTELGVLNLFNLPTVLAGNQHSIYAVFLLYLFLENTETKFLPKFANHAPRTAISLFLILCISELLTRNFLSLFSYILVSIFAYFYLILVFKEHSPFKKFHSFEEKLLGKTNTKNDEQFLEKMLTKISLRGKGSLNILEKIKLSRVMKKKKKEHSFL